MKEEIKKYILDNNLLYPEYNRNVSRKKFWDNRNMLWSNYIFDNYNKCKCKIKFVDFIRNYFFNEPVKNFYKTAEDFLENTISLQHNPGTNFYNAFFEDGCKHVNFQPVSMTELIYSFRNSIKNRPTCKECNNETSFMGFNNGYRTFCSQDCQMNYNNKLKEIKKSNNTTKQIQDIIDNIPLDLRNLTNFDVANNFINILEATSSFNNVSVSERIFVFQNNLSFTDVLCTCGNKRTFASQGVGYRKTCGRINCINISKNSNHFNNNEFNIRTNKGGASFKSGFLYILYSELNNYMKIGITQDPITRLTNLRKNINDFVFLECFWLNDLLSESEKELHYIFKEKRVYFDVTFDGYSEIFTLDDNDIKYIKEYIYDKTK